MLNSDVMSSSLVQRIQRQPELALVALHSSLAEYVQNSISTLLTPFHDEGAENRGCHGGAAKAVLPVLPKPSLPRSVSSSLLTRCIGIVCTDVTISCAILSPHSQVNLSLPLFSKSTMSSPR